MARSRIYILPGAYLRILSWDLIYRIRPRGIHASKTSQGRWRIVRANVLSSCDTDAILGRSPAVAIVLTVVGLLFIVVPLICVLAALRYSRRRRSRIERSPTTEHFVRDISRVPSDATTRVGDDGVDDALKPLIHHPPTSPALPKAPYLSEVTRIAPIALDAQPPPPKRPQADLAVLSRSVSAQSGRPKLRPKLNRRATIGSEPISTSRSVLSVKRRATLVSRGASS